MRSDDARGTSIALPSARAVRCSRSSHHVRWAMSGSEACSQYAVVSWTAVPDQKFHDSPRCALRTPMMRPSGRRNSVSYDVAQPVLDVGE